jgi:hypothetical protein
MSATDVPVHAGLGGRIAGEFAARPAQRRLATWAARWVTLVGSIALGLALRKPFEPSATTIVVSTLMFAGFALVGLAVRRARVTVDAGGVRWGWDWLGFRLERDRIRAVDVYRDAIAFRQRRGSTWFLTAWDWERFDALVLSVERSGLALTRNDRRAPLGARLQSYGRVLDGLLVLTIVGVAVMVALAATL